MTILATFNFVNFNFGNLINLEIFNFGNFGNFSIMATFNFSNFKFWQLQFWSLSILTIFSFDNFQAKCLNGVQEQYQQHINCTDLVIKIKSFFTGLCKNTNSMEMMAAMPVLEIGSFNTSFPIWFIGFRHPYQSDETYKPMHDWFKNIHMILSTYLPRS